MKKLLQKLHLGLSISLMPLLLTAQNVGIGTSTPNDKLDVVGTGHISSYLKVGNPTAPQTITPAGIQLYGMDAGSYYNGFTQGGCGTGWSGTITGATLQDKGGLRWDNIGARGNRPLYSPWMWVPSGAGNIVVEMGHYCTLENNFDGVYIQYSTNGATWNNIPLFYLGGYTGTAAGSNATCTGGGAAPSWTGTQDQMVTAFPINVSNTWVQLRIVGTEDGSVGTGVYWLFNFNVFCQWTGGAVGGAFATGNIYAEKNVYAGSNVLLGDLAEYFPIIGSSKPGDLISMVPGAHEKYMVTNQKTSEYIIGVHSTNPTLTLNDPNSGVPVGLQGRVPVNVVGKIKKGDYLTAAAIAGHATTATKASYVVGRALESYDSENPGQILCLLEPGWYNPFRSNSTQTSGTFSIRSGQKQVKVIDPSVASNSKIFSTMLGNPGSFHWIAEKGDGYFILEFEKGVSGDISFDYFIDEAADLPQIEPIPSTVVEKEAIATSKDGKGPIGPDINPLRDVPGTPILENNGELPPEVPNPEVGYWWSAQAGLQTVEATLPDRTDK